jgi:hypothetical protein
MSDAPFSVISFRKYPMSIGPLVFVDLPNAPVPFPVKGLHPLRGSAAATISFRAPQCELHAGHCQSGSWLSTIPPNPLAVRAADL